MEVGQIMDWHHWQGSYGFLSVKRVVVRKIGKRITIEVPLKDGGTRLTSVKPESLHQVRPDFGGEMSTSPVP
jgi:hypothetical protein